MKGDFIMPKLKRYTPEELKFIKNNYKKMTVEQIAKSLDRSEKAVRSKIEQLGLKLSNLKRNEPFKWTADKEKVILENYQKISDYEVAKLLDTSEGIVFRKRKRMGLIKKTREPFIQRGYWQRCEDGKRIWVHREIAEKKTGRKLKLSEPVHHVNGEKLDNSYDNLYVCKDRADHGRVHDSLEEVAFELYKMGLIKFNHKTGEYYHDLPTRHQRLGVKN